MRRLIVIGTIGNNSGEYQGKVLIDKLDELNLISELEKIHAENELEWDYLNSISALLNRGKIDIGVINMVSLPPHIPEGLAIGALSKRSDPAYLLLINQANVDNSSVLNIRTGSKVATASASTEILLKTILEDIEILRVDEDISVIMKMLENKEIDASIVSAAEVKWSGIDPEAFKYIRLNPKEFVPAPGQGISAYLCREKDIEMRKILSHIHCKTAARQSNIERKVLQLVDKEKQSLLGVFCEEDKMSNYHVYAIIPDDSDGLKKAFLSQSTHVNLPEKIIEQLKN